MKWIKGMPEKTGYYWLRITVNEDVVSTPAIVRIDAEPGLLPEMRLVASGARYTYREAEKELLEVYKSARLDFFGPVTPPEA